MTRELQRDACALDHVLQHERTHVQIYRDALPRVVERLSTQLNATAGSAAPGEPWGADELRQQALAALLEVRALHEAFDSPWEYDRNGRVCNRRVLSLLRLSRGY